MNRLRLMSSLGVVVFALGSISCQKAAAPKPDRTEHPTAAAVVAGTAIPVEALQAELRRQFRSADGLLSTEQKLAALDNLIRTETLYARAKADGFDQAPEMQARIKSLIIGHFKEQHLARATNAVTDQEIEQYYQASGGRYAQPAAIRGAIIFLSVPAVATAEKQAEVERQATELLRQAQAAADAQAFARLVALHSEDQASRYRGGETGWVTPGGGGTEGPVAAALLALEEPGQFAPLVRTPRGYYITKLLERREATRQPLAEVRDTVRYQLAREKAAQAEHDFYVSVKAGLDIHINRERVESVSLPMEQAGPPPPSPGSATPQLR